ncbi:MAG: hypothetical protein ACRETL_07290, partial [Gammaproteobacteria bacterium]
MGADDAQRAKAAVQNLRVRLTQRLVHDQDTRATRLADIAKRAGQILDGKLSTPMTAETAQPIIAEAKKILAEADALPPDAATSPAEDAARSQLAALAKKVDDLEAAARDALTARAKLAAVRNFEDYHAVVASLANSPLTNETTAAAARTLLAHNPEWNDAAQRILMPGDPATWVFLKQAGEARMLPAEVSQKEDLEFYQLINNNLLSNTYRADLVTYQEGDETARTPLALAGLPKETSIKLDTVDELQQTANPINTDGSTTEKSFDWKQFTGRKPAGQKLENIKLTPESQLMTQVHGAYSRDRDAIVQPLLRVLDDVRGDNDVSPIFKAYLEQEIFHVMQDRPRDWGLAFSPKAESAARELAKITGGHLPPTDWLFPAPASRLAANLQAFYERTAADSFFDDAMANMQALLKKRATSLRFAG